MAMVTNSSGTPRAMSLSGWLSASKRAVVALQLLIADRGLEAEHLVGIALGGSDVAGPDRAEFDVGKAEALGDLAEELFFLGVQRLVGLGDVEQTFEHVLEQLAVALEDDDELLGTSLVARHVLLGEIEDAGGLFHLRVRHFECAL